MIDCQTEKVTLLEKNIKSTKAENITLETRLESLEKQDRLAAQQKQEQNEQLEKLQKVLKETQSEKNNNEEVFQQKIQDTTKSHRMAMSKEKKDKMEIIERFEKTKNENERLKQRIITLNKDKLSNATNISDLEKQLKEANDHTLNMQEIAEKLQEEVNQMKEQREKRIPNLRST